MWLSGCLATELMFQASVYHTCDKTGLGLACGRYVFWTDWNSYADKWKHGEQEHLTEIVG
jgi:hypothetical protein